MTTEETQVLKEDLKENKILKRANVFQKISKAIIYFLIFLLPLFFLPWTNNVLDFNKQILLFILVFISLVCRLISGLISGRLEVKNSFLNLSVAGLLLTYGIATIFSLSRYGSFWGWPLAISSSFLSLLGLVIFYFLVANLFKKSEIPFLLLTLFLSGFFAGLIFILQLFGKFIFPFDFAKNISFNTIGTPNSFAIFFSLLLLLLLPLFFSVSRFFKIIFGIIGCPLLFSLFLINFKTAWVVFLVGTIILFVFGTVYIKKTSRSSFIILTMVFLVVALILTFFRFPLPDAPTIPTEVLPNQNLTFGILKQLSWEHLIFGTGLGTFVYDWSKYKPVQINQTIFWGVRFSQGVSEILDRAISAGILGILALFSLIVIFLKLILAMVLKKAETLDWFLTLGIMAGFVSLIVAFFLYPTNLTILFLFWLLVGCFVLLEEKERKIWFFTNSPVKNLGISFVFVLILVLGIGFSILYIQKYYAEVIYSKGLKALAAGHNELALNFISRAATLNPQLDLYLRDLSQIYLSSLNDFLAKSDFIQPEEIAQIQPLISGAVDSATEASNVSPNEVANWSNRGLIYRNMIGILKDADDWAIKSYQQAAELDPTNPYIFTEIAKIYLLKYDLAEQQGNATDTEKNIGLARENLEKALNVKSDYAPASFQMAMVYIREGNIKQAIDVLEITKQETPLDAGLAFQLGYLYYQNGQLDKAKGELERAISLDLNYSNARYFLGLIYDKEGNNAGAIEQFETIQKFNPDNNDVKKILDNLKNGKSALEGLVAAQP